MHDEGARSYDPDDQRSAGLSADAEPFGFPQWPGDAPEDTVEGHSE